MIIVLGKSTGSGSTPITGSEITLEKTDSPTAPPSGSSTLFFGSDEILRSKRSDNDILEYSYGIEHLLSSENLVIPARRQMVVGVSPTIEGELIIEGSLIMEGESTSGGGAGTIVENVLTSTSATNALSAAQGKVLNDIKVDSDTTGVVGAGKVDNMIVLTQAAYDAIATKDNNTYYIIKP